MHLYVSFFGITVSVRSIHNTVEFQKLEGLAVILLAKMWVHLFPRRIGVTAPSASPSTFVMEGQSNH